MDSKKATSLEEVVASKPSIFASLKVRQICTLVAAVLGGSLLPPPTGTWQSPAQASGLPLTLLARQAFFPIPLFFIAQDKARISLPALQPSVDHVSLH